MAFDYRHWGDSDGHPRGWLSLSRQQSDWRAAVTFARQLDGIDPDRVALWRFSMGGAMALTTAAADPRITAVIAVCPLTDGLAMWLEPAPPSTALRMLARAVRETITRRPVTMPVAGKPGDFAGRTAPEALPGFEHVTAGRPWRNEVSTSWLFPLAAFRPMTAVPRIAAPVLYQLARHDGMLPAGAADKAIPRTPRAEVRRYPMDHFGPFRPEHHPGGSAFDRPGTQVVCRAGAECYADGGIRGAAEAIQIADRCHLWHNLGPAAERAVPATTAYNLAPTMAPQAGQQPSARDRIPQLSREPPVLE